MTLLSLFGEEYNWQINLAICYTEVCLTFSRLAAVFSELAKKINLKHPLTSMVSKMALPNILKIASNQCISSKDWWEVLSSEGCFRIFHIILKSMKGFAQSARNSKQLVMLVRNEFCQVLITPLIQLGAMLPSCLTAQRSSSDDTRA